MSREADLDRAYSLLVLLCEDATPADPETRYALMTAFNLVADQHTPAALGRSGEGTRHSGLLAEAVALIGRLAEASTDLDEALTLGVAADLLDSIVTAGSDRR